MNMFLRVISVLLFSFCSGGKSPHELNSIERNSEFGYRDTKKSSQKIKSTQPLISDIHKRLNGSYKFKFGKTTYAFLLQNPEKSNGKLLVLFPGWNYPVQDWKNKTQVVELALKWGFQILFCDMGKSVYMDSIYPEAREDYKEFATRNWLWDSVLGPVSQCIGKGNMVLMGLSTGARGAVFLGMEHQNEVDGVIALSGDYFPNLDPKDKLMTHSMGPYSDFKNRWEKGANDARNLDGLPNFVYLAHGMRDKWVNPEHTLQLKKRLDEIQTNEKIHVRVNLGVHDYNFWNETGIEGLQLYKLYAKL